MAIETATIDQITNDGGGVQENDLLEISRNQITYKANINAILTRITNAENSITTLNGQVFINIKGNWDAATNTPNLLTITNKTGDAYKVNIAGSTDLDGEADWQVNDLAVYGADSKWFKIDNTQFSEINDSVIALNTTYCNKKYLFHKWHLGASLKHKQTLFGAKFKLMKSLMRMKKQL